VAAQPAAVDRQLVSQHQNLQLLRAVAASGQLDEFEQAANDDISDVRTRDLRAGPGRRRYALREDHTRVTTRRAAEA
jgi:hypothetical protein